VPIKALAQFLNGDLAASVAILHPGDVVYRIIQLVQVIRL
jgi:hypothetical protein